jgi:O-succinylbenzoate synthase
VITEHRLRIGDRDVLLLEGPAGWGECSPLAGYPCPPGVARAAALEAAGQGFPPPRRFSVPVNALVPAAAAVGPGLGARLDGYPSVKVKVGTRDPAADVDRVLAVRDLVGPRVGLRIDANGAWDLDTARGVLARLAPVGLELAEQPVPTLDAMASLRRLVTVPLAADEAVRSIADARRLRSLGAADALVLKVQPLGGVRAALDIAAEAGVPAVVSSMLETSIGIGAGVALAAALDSLPFACGLATLDELAGDVVSAPLRPRGGAIAVPDRYPSPDPACLARYAAPPA